MPYVDQEARDRLRLHADHGTEGIKLDAQDAGELTYSLTKVAIAYWKNRGRPRFLTICIVMGALICTALEFYRRVAVPYEGQKIEENRDVYD